MDFGFLVELVGEVEINLGKVQHLTHWVTALWQVKLSDIQSGAHSHLKG
jgi:hypothetical protein